jgi:SAM-dependent methyltransferase
MSIYSTFEPEAYLNEYYRTIAHDTLALLRFMVAAFRDAPASARVLDFGGGPTLYTAIVAAGRAAEIHLSDYSAANRAAVSAWLQADPAAFDWRGFATTVLQLEGASADEAAVATREALVRARLTAVLACDVTASPAISYALEHTGAHSSQPSPNSYDVLCTNLCLEAVARDADEWRQYLINIAALLRPGGRLIMTTVRRGRAYPVGDQLFPVAHIDEHDIQAALIAAGFSPTPAALEIVPSDHPVHPYDGLILTSALKAAAA